MIGRQAGVFVYDYATNNKIEDFIIQVENGRRKRVLFERTRDSVYWRDVGSIDAYYEASADLVGIDPLFNLYGEKWIFRTYERSLPPSKCIIGGKALESMVSDGCIISGGLVQRSILSPGVVVEKDALVEDSVILDDVVIEPGVKIKRAIVDKEAIISVSEDGIVVVPRGAVLSQT
jgi:glucose-1-phosphate adenylyltransferase